MYVIKKTYRNETKEILKVLNEKFYGYSKVIIDLKEGTLELNNNEGTKVFIKNFITIEELIHANLGSIKSFKYLVSGEPL